MANTQAVYHPLNGREIREVLIKDITTRINLIPLLKEGNAFDEAVLVYAFSMTCVPADCPVPTAEFEIAVRNPEFNLQSNYTDRQEKLNDLLEAKKRLEAQIEKIERLIPLISAEEDLDLNSVINVTVEKEVEINAGKTPDQVRIDHQMGVPRIVKTTDERTGVVNMSEKYIDWNKL